MNTNQYRFKDAFIGWILRRSYQLLFANLLIILAIGFGVNRLSLNTDWKIFFDKNDPNLLAQEKLEQTYGKADNILFIVAPDNKNVFTREVLSVIEMVTERAWQMPYSARVDSIANFQYPLVEGDEIIVESLVKNASAMTLGQLDEIHRIAINDIGLVNRLVSSNGAVTAVNITLNLPENSSAAVNKAVQYARKLKNEIEANDPNITIYLAGLAIIHQTFEEVAGDDVVTLIPGMFILILVLLTVLFRSLFATVATLGIILLSTIAGMGFAGWAGLSLNNVNASAPTIIMTLAIADCVHILTTFLRLLNEGKEKESALRESLSLNLYAIFLTSVTTAAGFLTLNFSESPPFRELGTISAFGVLGALWFSFTVLPGLISAFPIHTKVSKKPVSEDTLKIGEFVVKHQTPLFYIILFAVIVTASNIRNIELNDNPLAYFSKDVPMTAAVQFMEKNLSGSQSIQFSLDSGVSGGVSDPDFLIKVDQFAGWLRTMDEVRNVDVFTSTIKRLHQVVHGDRIEEYRLPVTAELAAQLILMYELSLPYGLDLNNQINTDKSSLRLNITSRNLKSNDLIELEKKASRWLLDNGMGEQSRGASQSLMFANIGQKNIESMIVGTAVAIILISLSLILALRSVWYGLLSFISNIFPALVTFGVWGILVGEVNIAASVVFSLTLGIIVDDTIHFLVKYIHGRRVLALTPEESVQYAFNTVAKALVTTSIALALGFLFLVQSDFVVNSTSGVLVAATITVALIIDLLFLPALLIKAEKLWFWWRSKASFL